MRRRVETISPRHRPRTDRTSPDDVEQANVRRDSSCRPPSIPIGRFVQHANRLLGQFLQVHAGIGEIVILPVTRATGHTRFPAYRTHDSMTSSITREPAAYSGRMLLARTMAEPFTAGQREDTIISHRASSASCGNSRGKHADSFSRFLSRFRIRRMLSSSASRPLKRYVSPPAIVCVLTSFPRSPIKYPPLDC